MMTDAIGAALWTELKLIIKVGLCFLLCFFFFFDLGPVSDF